MSELTCQHPDRHCRGMVCGYPLPCPHHTAIIEVTDDRVKVDVPKSIGSVHKITKKLIDIGRAIRDG